MLGLQGMTISSPSLVYYFLLYFFCLQVRVGGHQHEAGPGAAARGEDSCRGLQEQHAWAGQDLPRGEHRAHLQADALHLPLSIPQTGEVKHLTSLLPITWRVP